MEDSLGPAEAVGVPVVGIQFVVLEVLVSRTMKLIGARAGDEDHCAARETAVFGREAVGEDLELAHGFHRRNGGWNVVPVAGGDRLAIDEVLHLGGAAAVDAQVAVVVGDIRCAVHVWSESGEGERIAVVLGQFLNAAVVDDQPGLHVGGAEERDVGGDGDLLGLGADFHDKVQPHPVAHAEDEILAFQALETLEGSEQRVGTGNEAGDDVLAIAVGDGRTGDVCSRVLDGDGSARDDAPAGVLHGTGDYRVPALARESDGEEENDAEDSRQESMTYGERASGHELTPCRRTRIPYTAAPAAGHRRKEYSA